jgi:hypothetical protein
MNLHEQLRRTGHLGCCADQHGAVLVFVALLLVVLLGIAALAVDIGYVAITRNQLQNAADAGALAGAGKLGSIYELQTPPLSLNPAQAGDVEAVAIYVGQENYAASQVPNIESGDIVIGHWNSGNNTFSNTPPVGRIPNAVRVTGRPFGGGPTPLGSVTTFFANIFGTANVPVSATATASLTAPCNILPGGLSPFVISQNSPYCTTMPSPDIDFTGNDPSHPPCGGFQTIDVTANRTNIADFLNTLLSQNHCPTPCDSGSTNFVISGLEVGDNTHIMNGLVANMWPCLQNLYNCLRVFDPITGLWIWTVSVPVVARPCGQINQDSEVVSFATVNIKGITIGSGSNVVVAGEPCRAGVNSPCINATVVCDNVIAERGGGCAFRGTYGSIPGIVDKTAP